MTVDGAHHTDGVQGSTPRFIYILPGLAGFYFLANPGVTNDIIIYITLTCVTAYSLFCWTSCFHETAHQTLFRRPWMNIWFGRFIGSVILTPYSVYRESHVRHHAYLNSPADWELWPYSDPRTSRLFRRLFVWLDLALGVFTAPFIYGRIAFHRDTPIRSAALRRTIQWEYVAVAMVWTTVLTVVASMGWWAAFLRVWVVPHGFAGVFQTGRKLTEHLGMSSSDPLMGTRTVVGRGPLSRLCSFLNFDIFVHGPHHRQPRLPHGHLRRQVREFMRENPASQMPVYPSYARAVVAMLPWMWRNPAVGKNASHF